MQDVDLDVDQENCKSFITQIQMGVPVLLHFGTKFKDVSFVLVKPQECLFKMMILRFSLHEVTTRCQMFKLPIVPPLRRLP